MNRSYLTFFLLGKRYGFNLKKYLNLINESQLWDKQKIDDYQNSHLQLLIKHIYNKVPYYKQTFDELGLRPEDIKTKDDLNKIPIVNKQIVTERYNDFLSTDIAKRNVSKRHTGGTTGVAFEYFIDMEFWAFNWAMKVHTYEQAGYVPGRDKIGVLAGGSLLPQQGMGIKSRLWRFSQNVYSMPITRMNDKILDQYEKNIKKLRIQFLRGYPTSVYTLAKHILNKGNILPLKAVFTTAEMLYLHQREIIEKAFDCKIFDQYGCGDGGGHASECKAHDGLHHYFETSIMEIVKDGDNVKEGETGELVFTSLLNYSMPFIRYAPGDLAVKGNSNCLCGRKSEKITKIIGRSSDIIEFSNGNILNGLSIPFEAWTDKIKRFQIIQKEKDTVEVLFIPIKEFKDSDIIKAKKIMQYQCGVGVKILITLVDEIPLPKSGKFRYVISKKCAI